MKYVFRGVIVFIYNPENKTMESPKDNFNFCNFIPEDYILISDFFKTAYLHATGQISTEDLKDVEVY